jgi:TatD DNase family protein
MQFIDTHAHLDGEEFADDRAQVMARAKEAGAIKVLIPAIDVSSCHTVLNTCRQFPDFAFPMLGLHPEEVKENWQSQLDDIWLVLSQPEVLPSVVAIGEVGIDYYWSREFEQQQIEAFERQVQWAVQLQLPLMIHCRKGQQQVVSILKRYKDQLSGGVFHCFTGNANEAAELLQFDNFVLGIGGVLTFKKSHLPEVLASTVPLDRVVLETDAPYMAPVPMRGKRNESAFVTHVITKMAESYNLTEEEIATQTTLNAYRIFPKLPH